MICIFHPSIPMCRNHETFCRYPTNMHTVAVLHPAAGRAFQPSSCIEPPLGLASIFRVFFPVWCGIFEDDSLFPFGGMFFPWGFNSFFPLPFLKKVRIVVFPTWSFIVFLEALKNGCSGYQVPMKMFHHGEKGNPKYTPTNLRLDEKLQKK